MEVVVEYCETVNGIQYQTAQDIINTVTYVIDPNQTVGMVGTIGISLENYLNEMLLLKEAYGQSVDRHLVHVVVSSPEFRFLDYHEMLHLAFQIGMFYGIEHQVIFGVHPCRKGSRDKKGIHIHYVINSVNYVNGKYLSPDEYKPRLFKRYTMNLYREYGLQEYYELRQFRQGE